MLQQIFKAQKHGSLAPDVGPVVLQPEQLEQGEHRMRGMPSNLIEAFFAELCRPLVGDGFSANIRGDHCAAQRPAGAVNGRESFPLTGNSHGRDGAATRELGRFSDHGQTFIQHFGRVQFRAAVGRKVDIVLALGGGDLAAGDIEHDRFAAAGANIDAEKIHATITTSANRISGSG